MDDLSISLLWRTYASRRFTRDISTTDIFLSHLMNINNSEEENQIAICSNSSVNGMPSKTTEGTFRTKTGLFSRPSNRHGQTADRQWRHRAVAKSPTVTRAQPGPLALIIITIGNNNTLNTSGDIRVNM